MNEVHIPERYKSIEIVAADIIVQKVKYRAVVFYRPPYYTVNDIEYMTLAIECFKILLSKNQSTIIMGDFNLPEIDWNFYLGPANTIYDTFLSFINDCGLTQFVTQPTRMTNIADGNILDLVLSNTMMDVSSINVLTPFSSSDHCVISFNINKSA